MQTPFQIDLQTISDVYPNAVKFNQSTNEFHIIVEIDLQQPMKLLLEEDDLIQTAYEGLNETTVDYLPAIEISIQEPTDFVTFDELHFKLSCVWITENQTQEVLQFMQDMYDDMNGEGYLFAWYSYLSNTIDNLGIEEIHITEMEYIDHPKIFSFIGNSLHRQRALIQHHLDTKKQLFYEQKIHECPSCQQTKPIKEFFVSNNCSHPICSDCVLKQIQRCVSFSSVLKCFTCHTEISSWELYKFIDKNIIEKYEENMLYIMLRKENIILCPYCNSAIEVDDKSKVTAIYCPNCNGYSHTYLYKKQKHEEELRQISKAIQDDIKQSQHSKEVLSAQNKQVKQTKQTKKTKKTELIHIRPSNEYSTAKTNINYYITSQLSSPHFIERMNTYLIHSGLPNLVDDNFYGNTQSISLYFNMNLFFDPLVYQKITKFLKPNKDLLNYGFLCWHGTSISAASSIMRNGFDPSRRCGQAYGSGEYFGSHTAVSIGYGNCLILTYVIDSRSVSRYNFGFVVNNPFNSTYCLPIAFCVLGEFSLKNMFNLPISKEAYDCEWIFGESGLIVDNNLVREIFNSWSLINLGKRIEVNKNGIKHNLDYVGDLLWALTRDDCNTIVLSENDCSTMNMLFVSKPKKSVNIDFDIGSGSVDLINMTCTLANKKYLLTQFNPLDFQTI